MAVRGGALVVWRAMTNQSVPGTATTAVTSSKPAALKRLSLPLKPSMARSSVVSSPAAGVGCNTCCAWVDASNSCSRGATSKKSVDSSSEFWGLRLRNPGVCNAVIPATVARTWPVESRTGAAMGSTACGAPWPTSTRPMASAPARALRTWSRSSGRSGVRARRGVYSAMVRPLESVTMMPCVNSALGCCSPSQRRNCAGWSSRSSGRADAMWASHWVRSLSLYSMSRAT